MGVNLSDIAAMGGRPTAAVVGLVLPRSDGSGETIRQLQQGLREMANQYQVPIVGGDTNSWTDGLVVSVTVLGEPIRAAVLRSGAQPGDWIFVTGPVGGSILGRHLKPVPRLIEAEQLVKNYELRAMIDISDGLAQDLGHIGEESGCGIVLHAAEVPIHPDAFELAKQTGKTALAHALGDGEDFELIFTVSAVDGARLLAAPPCPIWKVGVCVAEPGIWLEEEGRRSPLAALGWEHSL
jgi:thiamine-monophosphate kinase